MESFIRDEYIARKDSGLADSVWVDRDKVRVKKYRGDPQLQTYTISQKICDWSAYNTGAWDNSLYKLLIHE